MGHREIYMKHRSARLFQCLDFKLHVYFIFPFAMLESFNCFISPTIGVVILILAILVGVKWYFIVV